MAQSGSGLPDYRVFRGEPSELRSAAGVLRGVSQGHSADLIQLGLLLLIATPVLRWHSPCGRLRRSATGLTW